MSTSAKNKDTGATMSQTKKLVMVESFLTYRIRHVIQLNESDPTEWAMDTVAMGEADEFSQLCLGDQISSHRVVSEEECFQIFKEDNEYLNEISYDRMMEISVHTTVDSDE
tara:strand:- start:3698 stop:4030 length:333 start_codon:yes stop_codon:yes gene_type:complete